MSNRKTFRDLFTKPKPIIGMIHLLPLPGTPGYGGSFDAILDRALNDARSLEAGGADAALVQNRGDKVYYKDTSLPEIVAAVALVTKAVRRETRLPIGVHLLRNDVVGSLAVATLCSGQFIRVAAGIGATYLPQGIVEAQPTRVLHERLRLGAENILMLCDVDSFHYRPLLPHPPELVAKELRSLGLLDAAVIAVEDEAVMLEKIAKTKAVNSGLPVLVGGYSTPANIARLLTEADGAIVGGAFEGGGRNGPVVRDKVEQFMAEVARIRD